MMQEFANSNAPCQTLDTMNRVNGLRINTKKYSTATDIGKHLPSKYFHLFRTLFGDSLLVTTLILGLVLGSIQESAASSPILTGTVVTTTYSSAWTNKSLMFSRHIDEMGKYYYYETIQVTVLVMGTYTFTSNSPINTYGYLYGDEFNPRNLALKLISEDDDSDGQGQFKITAVLQSGQKYILLATTYDPETIGAFSIVSSGPAIVDFGTTKALAASAVERATTTYSGSLSSSSQMFSRPGTTERSYYYQAIRVTVIAAGTYTFTSSSSMDTYGCLYSDSFDPTYPSRNLFLKDDDGNGDQQFRISVYLEYGQTYILIVTTYTKNIKGSFGIKIVGPTSIGINAYTPSTRSTSTRRITTTSRSIYTTYSSILSSNSPIFSRPDASRGNYYYQAIQVTVYTTGYYTFSSSSSVDTYGCLYSDSFDPTYPSRNLMKYDDDSDGNQQFRIYMYLQARERYYLVVTTFSDENTGSFSIHANGSASVGMIPYTYSTRKPKSTTGYQSSDGSNALKIVGITFGCIALVLGICIFYVHRRNRNVTRRAPRASAPQVPYTVSIPRAAYVEEPPPSYDMAMSYLKAKERERSN